MKLIALIALITTAGHLSAADKPAASADPLAGAFFSPDIVLLARDQIGLPPEQQESLHTRMEKVHLRSDELRAKLEHEAAALSALANQEHVNEAELSAQLDKVLDIERELKHLHMGLAASIKNQMTPEQQAKLREIARDGGKQLVAEARQRLSKKVELVTEAAHKWAESGRDPSAIIRAMDEKFKPLLEAGKVLEAEAELDRVLGQLNETAK